MMDYQFRPARNFRKKKVHNKYKEVAKIAQNNYDRDRSRVCICRPMVKWLIYGSPFQIASVCMSKHVAYFCHSYFGPFLRHPPPHKRPFNRQMKNRQMKIVNSSSC